MMKEQPYNLVGYVFIKRLTLNFMEKFKLT